MQARAQVYNNTVVNSVKCPSYQVHSALYFGVAPQNGQTGFGHPANLNPKIHHNIICMWSGSNRPMIEIRYSNEYGGMSGLSGKPTMNNNCYYIAGKNATFNDNRPAAVTNMRLSAWQTHIGGDTGSIETDPALNADYMPTNPQCNGMGIQFPLYINDPAVTRIPKMFLPEFSAHINNNILFIESPSAETIQVYSIIGELLFDFQKLEGKANYFVNQSEGTVLIVKGSSGWVKKVFVQ